MSWETALDRQIHDYLPDLKWAADEPMAKHTSFRIGGPAKRMAFPKTREQLVVLMGFLQDAGVKPLLIGNGTNLLVADKGLDTVVIDTSAELSHIELTDEGEIAADAGVSLAKLALFAWKNGLTGLEFAHGIPGTLGGGVVMNAGAYGGELKDVVTEVTALYPDGVKVLTPAELDFSYRHSVFSAGEGIVLGAKVKLESGDPDAIKAKMDDLMARRKASQPLELPSAGKSSAATYLEDMGYYTVDNVPADIILKFAEFCAQSDGRYDRVALVSDIRSGNGNFQGILDAMERLKQGGDICRLLFVTADLETIIKRYKETRRRHPLMSDGMTIEQAMHREQELLRPLREHADFVIDTTLMPAAKLRNELYGLFGDKSARGKLSVNVVSFGFKYGIPLEADLVFDVRFLPNPFYVPELKHKTGMDSEVYDYVFSFPQTKTFIDKLEGMLSFLLPLYAEEGKSTLVIAVGCTGGHHRSVSVARCIASYLTALGYPAFENHRDITRG